MPRSSQRDQLLPMGLFPFAVAPRLLAVLERGGDGSGKAIAAARKVTLAAETLAKGGAAKQESRENENRAAGTLGRF